MNFANYLSVLKSWGGHAAAGMVRLKALAPYALIELILPGGSMMALLLWLYRRRRDGVRLGRSAAIELPSPCCAQARGIRPCTPVRHICRTLGHPRNACVTPMPRGSQACARRREFTPAHPYTGLGVSPEVFPRLGRRV
jgi:hypothetical protein